MNLDMRVLLRNQDVFLQGRDLAIVQCFFATVDLLCGGREHFDYQLGVLEVDFRSALPAARYHDVRVVKELILSGLQSQLDVRHISIARASAQVSMEGGKQISRDSVVRLGTARHGVEGARDEF